MTTTHSPLRSLAVPAVVLLGLTVAACGSESDAAGDQIASLDDDVAADAVDVEDDVTESADEAALAFSQCLRDNGVEVPDIGVDADGNIDLRDAFESIDRSDGAVRDAMEACQDLLAGGGFGGGRGGFQVSTEMQDALVEFTDCMRDQGFEDVEDLSFGPPDGGEPPEPPGGAEDEVSDEPPGPAAGERDGAFGDPATAFATRLGLDPEDPEVIAALDVCMPILEQAFADAGGPGQADTGTSEG